MYTAKLYFKIYHFYNNIMAKRVTIVLDDDLGKKIRLIQTKQIKDLIKSVSFSSVINQQLRKILK